MELLITTTMCFEEKRSQKQSVESASKAEVSAFVAIIAKLCLLGRYWFEKNGLTVTINSERTILDQFHCNLTKKLTQGQLRLIWLMQDGARPHTTYVPLDISGDSSEIISLASTQIMSGPPQL